MMYFKQINPIGCLLWTILLVWIFFKLKLYFVVGFIALIAVVFHYYNKAKMKIQEKQKERELNFEPEVGEVYKVCPYCGNDVKRIANICPHCQSKLD